MVETWRDIPGYGGKYQVDMEGNVRRVYASGRTRGMTPYHRRMSGSQRLVVKLTRDGREKEEVLMRLVALAFLGPPPEGCVPYHRNGCQSDNYLANIAYIDRRELGRMTGAKSRRRPVAKIDRDGHLVEVYPSAREAARRNYMSYQTVMDRCNGKAKGAFAPDGYAYAWDDSEASIRRAMRKIEKKEEQRSGKDDGKGCIRQVAGEGAAVGKAAGGAGSHEGDRPDPVRVPLQDEGL